MLFVSFINLMFFSLFCSEVSSTASKIRSTTTRIFFPTSFKDFFVIDFHNSNSSYYPTPLSYSSLSAAAASTTNTFSTEDIKNNNRHNKNNIILSFIFILLACFLKLKNWLQSSLLVRVSLFNENNNLLIKCKCLKILCL